ALQLPSLLQQSLHPLDHVVGFGAQQACQLTHALVLLAQMPARPVGGQRSDAPDPSCSGTLRRDLDAADVPRPPDVRATAQLHRPGLVGSPRPPALRGPPSRAPPHGDNALLIAVLFAK